MFDIGFWEMAVVALVALLVIGPKELPALIRGVSRWMARARQVAGEFKGEFTREIERAEELRRLVEKETGIAEVHRTLEEARKTIPVDGERPADGEDVTGSGDAAGEGDDGRRAAIARPEAGDGRADGSTR